MVVLTYFLLNPAGIIFGPNAELDIGGSFFASTANTILFEDNQSFSATNPDPNGLLSINLPIGLQYGANSAAIQVQQSNVSLRPGETLALVGGNVQLDGATLRSPGGRVELGGLSGEGTVALNGLDFLSFPEGSDRADISLNQSRVDMVGGSDGDINIHAGNLQLTASQLQAGIGGRQGQVEAIAGDIQINATGNITLTQASEINNQLPENALGSGGNITIQTTNLTVQNGSSIGANTKTPGNAGNITVRATDTVELIGQGNREQRTGLFSSALENSSGNGGNITVETRNLTVGNGATISANTLGQGDGGTIAVIATEQVQLNGTAIQGQNTGLFSSVITPPTGQW